MADKAKMLEAAKTEPPVAHVLYSTVVYTGMRARELAGLRWWDVDLVHRTMNIRCVADRVKHSNLLRKPPLTASIGTRG